MTAPTKPSDVLEAAAEKVEAGWCQGAFSKFIGGLECFCVRGAIITAARDRGILHQPAEGALARYLLYWPLALWNDSRGRTQAEVVGVLRRAAAAEREAGR